MFVYLQKSGHELRDELSGHIQAEYGPLLVTETDIPTAFALDIWPNAEILTFQSISEAQALLKQRGRFWLHYPSNCFRRGTLIQKQLRKLPMTPPFTFPLPTLPDIGVFSLLDQHTLICCAKSWKPIPGGRYDFIEDKKNPPNRAYLKLWEALSFFKTLPKPEETCLDLGASPGGWTWVMQQLGTTVTAVDKAPLAPPIAQLPHVHYIQQSAFALDPSQVDVIDWWLCDVICYPDRLLPWLQRWLTSGKIKQLICTIKLQGETHAELIHALQRIDHAVLLQLWHNKHELTLLYPHTALSLRTT